MEKLLRWDQVMRKLGIGSRTAFKRWLSEHPEFPQAVDIGKKQPMKRWKSTEVEAWMTLLCPNPDRSRAEVNKPKNRPLQS